MKRSIKFQIMARIVAVVLVILISFPGFSTIFFNSINMNNLFKRGSEEAQRNLIQAQSAIEDIPVQRIPGFLSEEVNKFLKGLNHYTASEKAVESAKLMGKLDAILPGGEYIHSFCIVTEDGESFLEQMPL